MKTWLIRRAVRRPVLLEVTSRMSSSVCRLPFIRSSPLACVDQLDRLRGRRFAMRHVDDLEAVDIEAVLARHCRDLGGGPDQDRNDDAGLRRLDGAAQRGLVAGMHHDGRRRRHLLGLARSADRISMRADPAGRSARGCRFRCLSRSA